MCLAIAERHGCRFACPAPTTWLHARGGCANMPPSCPLEMADIAHFHFFYFIKSFTQLHGGGG